MLQVIEAAFGDFVEFNRIVRQVFATRVAALSGSVRSSRSAWLSSRPSARNSATKWMKRATTARDTPIPNTEVQLTVVKETSKEGGSREMNASL